MPHRTLQPFILTALLIALPFSFLAAQDKRAALSALFLAMPYLLYSTSAFLAVKVSQSRVLHLAFLMMVSYAILAAPWLDVAPDARARALATAVPFGAIGIFLLPRTGWAIAHWLLASAVYLIPLSLALAIAGGPSSSLLFHWLFQPGGLSPAGYSLPSASLGMAIGFLALGLFGKDRAERELRVVLAAAFVPLLYVWNRHTAAGPPADLRLEATLGYCSAGLLAIYATLRLYWQRVYLDELTQLPNRRALNERLALLRPPFAIAMADIDHFKAFNDTYGHEQGDSALRFVARFLERTSGGHVYRYGGEEFTLVFEGVFGAAVADRLDDVREALAKERFHLRASAEVRSQTGPEHRDPTGAGKKHLHLTVSLGVADSQDAPRAEETLGAADSALYRAKSGGRDQVRVYSDSSTITSSLSSPFTLVSGPGKSSP